MRFSVCPTYTQGTHTVNPPHTYTRSTKSLQSTDGDTRVRNEGLKEEKRIYVVVAETVQTSAGNIVQPCGRVAAQVAQIRIEELTT